DMIRIPTAREWEETKNDFGLIKGGQSESMTETAKEPGESTGGTAGQDVDSGKVNINTADEATLCTLPGIGEAKAAAIIEYRNAHGGFSTVDDIRSVSGIGDKLYQKIRDRITV
ncbi:MAG: helix-hairpin-helix domain-containing protein, partial [Lachnospiraceae bacterium]|nr:helix-hairpin-helix domain-containing protein [Lachnospiraceae bacterium]